MSAERGRCECGGEIIGHGGIQDYGGTHEGYVWGGNCTACGRGYGENEDEPPRVRVDQTRFGRGEGNCFAACVAITGLDLDMLTERLGHGTGGTWDDAGNWTPTPGAEHWYDRAARVLAEFGWSISYDTVDVPEGFCIASGPAARGLLHSTVALDGELWHDPHPSRAGLVEATDYITLTRLSAPPTASDGTRQ